MSYVASIIERYSFFEDRAVRAQYQFDSPLHAINAIRVADENRSAAVRILAVCKINRRHGDPVVRYGKIEFDAEGGPCSAIADLRLLDGRIGIEHRLAVDLVDAGVKMAPDVRQNGALQVLVFEIDRAQGVVIAAIRQVVADRVRVIEVRRSVQIKRRIWIRRTLFIHGQRQSTLPYAHFRLSAFQTPRHQKCGRQENKSAQFSQSLFSLGH